MVAKTDLLDVLTRLNSGVVVHAADTSVVFANHRAAALLGVSEAQMRGRTALDPGWHFVDADGVKIRPEQYPVSQVVSSRQALQETVFGVVSPQHQGVLWLMVSAFPEVGSHDEIRRVVVNFHDISDLKRAQESLRDSERTYRTLFETIPQGVVYQDVDGHITSANPAAQRILGLSLDQMQGRTSMDPTWKAIQADGSPLPGDQHPSMLALRTQQPVTGVIMGILAPHRGLVWMSVNAAPVFRDGRLVEVYAIFEDITERRRLEDQIAQLAFFDPLTHLPNRRLFDDRMQQLLAAQQRHPKHSALIVIDLDNFKPLNDRHGHAVGDLLLGEVARRLTHCVRQSDTVARFGGDEFAVIVDGLSTQADLAAAQAQDVAEKISGVLSAPYHLRLPERDDGSAITHAGSASLGVALFHGGLESASDIFQRADQAMYRAKAAGRQARTWAAGAAHQVSGSSAPQ